MAEISRYDPSMLVWLDETGYDNRNVLRIALNYSKSFTPSPKTV